MSNKEAVKHMPIEGIVKHYQRSIERSENDSKRLLHCLAKLDRLHVKVQHLQATGIGRTVNALRKDEGEVGIAAKALVSKWREMVAAEHSSDSSQMDGEDQADSSENENSDTEINKISDDYENHKNNELKHHKHHHNENHGNQQNHQSHQHSRHSTHSHSPLKHKSERNECQNKISSKSISNGDSSDNEKVKIENGDDRKQRKHNHHSEQNGECQTKSLSSKDKIKEKSRKKHNDESKHDSDNHRKKHKHHHKDRQKESSTAHKLSSKRKYDETEIESSSSKRHKNDSNSESEHKKSSSSKSSTKKQDGLVEIDHSMGTSFADALGMMEPTSSKSSSSKPVKSHSKSSSSSSTSKSKPSTSGTSSSRSKDKSNGESSSSTLTAKPSLLSPKAKLPPLEDITVELPPPTITNNYKPSPMNSLIMDCVFRPQPMATASKPLRPMTDEEALGASMSSRTMRTKVYSGIKTGTLYQVPSLHELCVRLLQKNIDAIEYTGGVPFELLRPILERATPNQLCTFEHYNPYIMEDSDVLWQQHCARKFRGEKRQEMESWREMFLRCTHEQEARLNSLANTIKQSQSVAVPVKKTKLAYIDSMVKPPRSIQKKQTQFGTERKLIATPAARTTGLSSVAANMARIGDVRLRTSAAMRDTAQAQPSAANIKRKAPLMQKSIQLLRGRFKR